MSLLAMFRDEAAPTVDRCFSDLLGYGGDRMVIVRRPRQDSLTGLAILLAGMPALLEVAPAVMAMSELMPSTAPMPQINSTAPLDEIFEAMESTGLRFLAVPIDDLAGQPAACLLILGDQVCRDLAVKLTALGMPIRIEEGRTK